LPCVPQSSRPLFQRLKRRLVLFVTFLYCFPSVRF
jgi:hypothetical protein